MSKQELFKHVRQLHFPTALHPLLNLIEKNLSQVEFVKDHMGLNNFLFLAENEVLTPSERCFACFNLEVGEDDKATNYIKINKSKILDIKEIYEEVNDFFQSTNDTLYVEIGFKESMPSQEDQFRIYKLLKSKTFKDIKEAELHIKRFPSWYEAKFPTEIKEFNELIQQLENIESSLVGQLKKDVLAQLRVAIEQEDMELFSILCQRYKKVCMEIS